ncbi:HAD-IA family hydrolase [Sagittula sp. SSi028]|uniref:HAD-IA family hydrolase n=1 Tax=Sagittula sp. SSi028 TaxID=3400636 RepID=UPI003AF826D0
MTTLAFDLDGTLIDSMPHIHHCVSAGLADLGLPGITRADTPQFVGRGLPTLCTRVLAHLDADSTLAQDLYDRTMIHYVATPNSPDSVYPGVTAALHRLTQAGHRLTLCTNKPRAATLTALRDTGLHTWFDHILAGDSLPTRKPDPAMLRGALDGCPADQALYIGDSETDCETARAAGVRFILFTEGYRQSPPEALPHVAKFADWAALPAIIQDLA